MNYKILVLGAGGHARVLIDILKGQSMDLIGVCDSEVSKTRTSIYGVPCIGDDSVLGGFSKDSIRLVNGVGSHSDTSARADLFIRCRHMGFSFENVVHPASIVAGDTDLGEGIQLMAGSIVQVGCRIGANVLVNTGASVDHDCVIGDHTHLAPGVTLSGGVTVGDGVHIGTGANIIQGIRIGRRVIVAAGATVVQDVPSGLMVAGVPAKSIKS
jgi:sugar O-acyltransferase (sialic acid O-acetyltransferase NeuD family)